MAALKRKYDKVLAAGSDATSTQSDYLQQIPAVLEAAVEAARKGDSGGAAKHYKMVAYSYPPLLFNEVFQRLLMLGRKFRKKVNYRYVSHCASIA